MRYHLAAPVGAAMLLALAGCNKPASETTADAANSSANAAADTAGAATDAAATATAGAADAGGAVSPPPAVGNDAVNPDANTGETKLAPGSNSFTEGQARGHIESAGYTGVSALTKTESGMWTGKAMKDGKSVNVSVDFKGAVSAK